MIVASPIVDRPDGLSQVDRRTHARMPVTQLEWVREVRLKYGPPVSLVDLSEGGALIQSSVQLRPGTTQVLEIVAHRVEIVPSRVLRCHIAQLGKDGPLYRGACQFKRPIDAIAHREQQRQARLDLMLRELLLAQRKRAVGSCEPRGSALALPRLLRSLQAGVVSDDPLSRGIRDVLSEVVPALSRGESKAVLRARLQDHLRAVLPALGITVTTAPLTGSPGNETIYFSTGPVARPRPC